MPEKAHSNKIRKMGGMFGDIVPKNFRSMDHLSGFRMSTQNLENLNHISCSRFIYNSRPIAFSTPMPHHRHHKATVPKTIELRQSQQKGIIFVWPQRRRYYSKKELKFAAWLLAHTLFWLHVTNILPSGAAFGLSQPPWSYRPPLPKPENRDYIIEPDWDSCYL